MLIFKSKNVKLLLLSKSSMVNSKIGCNLVAVSRTTTGSPLTVPTMSSTYLAKILTPFSVRSAFCCSICYHTVSAIFAYSDSHMLPHPNWYQFKQASHSTRLVRYVTFSDIQDIFLCYLLSA